MKKQLYKIRIQIKENIMSTYETPKAANSEAWQCQNFGTF